MEFTNDAWLLLIFIMVLNILLFQLIQRIHHTHNSDTLLSIMHLYGITVQQSVDTSHLPKMNSCRIYLIALFLQTVLVVTMYSSKLESSFLHPLYYDDINTVEDFTSSDLIWGHTGKNMMLPLANDPKRVSQIAYSKFKVFKLEEMKHLVDTKQRFGIMVGRSITGFWNLESYVDGESIQRYKVLKDSLMQIWSRQTFFTTDNKPVQRYLNTYMFTNKETIVLTTNHLLSIFILWGFGLTLATLIFLLEFLKYYLSHKNY